MPDIIIGAGLSGLSCGYHLPEPIVLEKDIAVGGLAKTITFEDFAFDLGGHRFLTEKPQINKFIKDLLKDDLIEVNRKSKIFKNNRFFNYPLTPNIMFQLNAFVLSAATFTYLLRKIKPLKEKSFREKIINNFGDGLYRDYFKNYTEKVWSLPCSEISPDWVDARISNMSLLRVISNAFTKKYKTKSLTDKFYYPKDGIGTIAEKLAAALNVRLNSKLTGLVFSKNRIISAVINNKERIDCDNLISTMPITDLAKLLNPPSLVQKAINNLKYRDLICVFLVINKNNYSDNHWIYFPGKEIFGRLHEPKNWSPNLSPDNKTGICLEIFVNRNHSYWQKDDLELAHAAIKDLPLVNKVSIKDHIVIRIKNAYPVYDINYKSNLTLVKNFLSGFENLYTLGRTGNFNYLNMDGCLEEGIKLAEVIKQKYRVQIPQ